MCPTYTVWLMIPKSGRVFPAQKNQAVKRCLVSWKFCAKSVSSPVLNGPVVDEDRFVSQNGNIFSEKVNYPLSKANGLPASSTSQPTISTGVNSGCTSPICILLSYAICRNPSAKIFFAALMSLSCHAPQTGHIHSLTDKSFVSSF